MGDTKFSDVWRMMSQIEFKADSTSVTDELACFMCKKLMIDACQTACGCQYCYKCISEYVVDDSTYCPGGRQECNEEYLVLERDVMRNIRMNNKIYKLSVYCPNESCLSIMELSKMEEHLRLCSKKDTVCPCAALGCDKTSDNIRCDASSHTELLVGWITNLKNEIDGVKEKLSDCEIEIESLREESNTKDMQIAEIIDQKEYYKREMEIVKEEAAEREQRIVNLERKFEDTKSEKNLGSLEIIKQFELLKKDVAKRIGKLGAVNIHGNKDHAAMADLAEEVCAIKEVLERVLDDQQSSAYSNAKLYPASQNHDDGYTWKIDGISLIRGAIYSDNFYCKKYRLCIAVLFKDECVMIWCYIVRGDNDDSLQWPMTHAITFSVINQKTQRASKSRTFQYESYNSNYLAAFDRPIGSRNELAIGYNTFFKLSKLPDISLVVVNDSVVVSCVLVDP